MKFILVESIEPLNEGKKIGDDTYVFESAESLFEFLENARTDIRVLYDDKLGLYFGGTAFGSTHADLVNVAYKNGYYGEYSHAKSLDYMLSLYTIYFSPTGSLINRDTNYYAYEGYKGYIETKIGTLYWRDWREEGIPSDLYELLKRKNLIVSEGEVEEVNESLINEVYPNKGESKEDFISRFMSVTKDEYPDQKQRYAVALSYWDRRNK